MKTPKKKKVAIKEIRNAHGELIGLEINESLTLAEVKKYYPTYLTD